MTAREPGARLVLTVGLTESPRSTACLASRPAATITEGLEVLVQLVIAAMATEPLVIGVWVPLIVKDHVTMTVMATATAVPIATFLRQLLMLVFFLSNRIRIGFSAFSTKANEGIFCSPVFLQILEAVGKGFT